MKNEDRDDIRLLLVAISLDINYSIYERVEALYCITGRHQYNDVQIGKED